MTMERADNIDELSRTFAAAFKEGKQMGLPMAWMLHDEEHDALAVALVTDLDILPDMIAAVEGDANIKRDIDNVIANYRQSHPGLSEAYVHLIGSVGG